MILLALALAPAIVIMMYIYMKDKYEREPIKFVLKNFGLGASASIIITLIIGFILKLIFPTADPLSVAQQFFKAFVVVALVEEFSKYIIVRYYAQRNKEFDEPFDGIVYAVMVSMGFAAIENIMYVFQFGMAKRNCTCFYSSSCACNIRNFDGLFYRESKVCCTQKR
ncbi:Protease PrsW [Polaribacter huanghezhanensis]|nr:Protease PrsW [Polaribacter huanghezhanensis]